MKTKYYKFSHSLDWSFILVKQGLAATWVTCVISAESKGQWCIVDPMQLAYVYPAISMSTPQMLFQNVILEPFCVEDASHSLHLLDVSKRIYHFVRIAIGWGTLALPQLQLIRGRQSIVIPVVLRLKSSLQCGHLM